MVNVIEIDGVQLTIGGQKILRDVYMKLEQYKVTVLMGINGAGKSSLFHVIFGTKPNVESSLRWNKQVVKKLLSHQLRFVPQYHFIPKNLTIKKVLSDFNIDESQFLEYFPKFKELLTYKLKHLSGGERKILELCSILMSDCSFCILDEPFAKLSPINIEQFQKVILEERKQKGILLSDHQKISVDYLGDHFYEINEGRISPLDMAK